MSKIKSRTILLILVLIVLAAIALAVAIYMKPASLIPEKDPPAVPEQEAQQEIEFLPMRPFREVVISQTPVVSEAPDFFWHADFRKTEDLLAWDIHEFQGLSTYQIRTVGEEGYLFCESDGTSSALLQVVDIPITGDPVLSWDWKVDVFPTKSPSDSLSAKDANDFPMRIYVVFKAKVRFLSYVIQYLWDEHSALGEVAGSPYSGRVKMLVVESGKTAQEDVWIHEERNIRQDYKQLFGKDADVNIQAIGFMTDSDNTKSHTQASFRNMRIQLNNA